MRQILIMALYCAVLTFPLAACGGTLRVEPDPYDPKLHGQVVRFTVPMVYMKLTDTDLGEFTKKEIAIGRILVEEQAVNSLFNREKNHEIIKIDININFTIIDSFWVRHDWFTREFASDYQMITLKDEFGILSTCLRSLLINSNRKELR